MDDVELALLRAWERIAPELEDPHKLVRRMARRRGPTLQRPPRAWCLAVRASDTRINPATAAMVPEDAAYPGRPQDFGPHTVRLEARLLRRLCAPVTIAPPGEVWDRVARRLGVGYTGLTTARLRGVFHVHYVQGLAARWGNPVPLLYTRRPLDPSAPLFAEPDRAWDWTAHYLLQRIPEDLSQTIERIPWYAKRWPEPRTPHDLPPRGPSRRLPKAPPDWVWYKWQDGYYVGDRRERLAEKRMYRRLLRRAGRPPKPRKAVGSLMFRGWRWICPGCRKPARVLYYPLPPINLLKSLRLKVPQDDLDDPPPPCFACWRCHRVRGFSRVDRGGWNQLVAYLTGGLLYGREVERPAWLTPDRKRPYRPRLSRAPSRRREEVLQGLLEGKTYAQIAKDLGIGWSTVHWHAKIIHKQHRVHGRAELARKLGSAAPQYCGPAPVKHQEVRRRLLAGESYQQIARAMGISWNAVHHHAKRVHREAKRAGDRAVLSSEG